MSGISTKRAQTVSTTSALVCALLCLLASFDLGVLALYIDHLTSIPVVLNTLLGLEDPLEDEDMLHPRASGQDSRRGDRKHPRPQTALSQPNRDNGRSTSATLPSNTSRIDRTGCEHAGRNGLGAPLLC